MRAAPPIVVLPGMDGTGDLLRPFADLLSVQRRVDVVAYPTDKALGYDALIGLIEATAPQKPYFILGESFSGPIAIEIAASDRRVAGLILASSFARHPLPTWFQVPARWINVSHLPDVLMAAVLLGRQGSTDLRTRLGRTVAAVRADVLQSRAVAALQVDKRAQLRSVRCPILCLAGRRDRLLGERCVREICAAQPKCDVVWLDAPHMLLETHPEDAAEAVNQFCARVFLG